MEDDTQEEPRFTIGRAAIAVARSPVTLERAIASGKLALAPKNHEKERRRVTPSALIAAGFDYQPSRLAPGAEEENRQLRSQLADAQRALEYMTTELGLLRERCRRAEEAVRGLSGITGEAYETSEAVSSVDERRDLQGLLEKARGSAGSSSPKGRKHEG